MESEERRGSGFAAGLVLGAFIGAGVAVLLASKMSEETRGRLRERGTEMRERTRERAEEMAQRARAKAQEFRGRARETVEDLREKAQEILRRRDDVLGREETSPLDD